MCLNACSQMFSTCCLLSSSGEDGAAVLSELQADLHAGGRPRPNAQHQGAASQIRQRARAVQR